MIVQSVIIGVVIVVALWRYFQKRNSVFRQLKIAHPDSSLLVGNLPELLKTPQPFQLQKWTKELGKTYGYMEGGLPVIVSSDLDVLQDVFIKKFGNFHARKSVPLHPNPDHLEEASVFMCRGMRWKRLRAITSPAFTSAKLKKLTPTVEQSVRRMREIMDGQADSGKPFNIHLNFQQLTMEVIAKVALGDSRDLQSDPNNPYLGLCQQVFAPRTLTTPMQLFSLWAMILPEMKSLVLMLWKWFQVFQPFAFERLLVGIRKVVKRRKALKDSYGGPTDFIQLFLDAEAEDGWQKDDSQLKWDESKSTGLRVDKKLTQAEINSQCNMFMLAGFDTTSNALAYAAYLLAIHPEYQDSLKDHLDDIWNKDNDSCDVEALMKMELLDQILKETLRLYPLASRANGRTCDTACYIGDVWVPQGMQVAADVWSLHYDPEIWGDDAAEFRPERFSHPPKHPLAWQPFGGGPRTCIGMRFALIEAKLAIAHIVKHFHIQRCHDTQVPLKLCGSLTVSPESVDVVLERR